MDERARMAMAKVLMGADAPSLDVERLMAQGGGLSEHYLRRRRDATFDRNIALLKAVPFTGFSAAAFGLGQPTMGLGMGGMALMNYGSAVLSNSHKKDAAKAQRMFGSTGLPDRPTPNTFMGEQDAPGAYPYRRPSYGIAGDGRASIPGAEALPTRLPPFSTHRGYEYDNWLYRSGRQAATELGYMDGGY